MGFLNFFKKKDQSPEIEDLVWINQHAKLNGCLQQFQQDGTVNTLLAWSSLTKGQFQEFLKDRSEHPVTIELASYVDPFDLKGSTILFLEHHPILSKERMLLEKLKVEKARFLVALDDPIFRILPDANMDNLASILEKLGLHEGEVIQHKMVSKAINRVQSKIEKTDAIYKFIPNDVQDWWGGIS